MVTQYDPSNFKLEIKAVQTAGGEETPCFQLKLYINGKRAAEVSNEGTGGQCLWRWENKEIESLFSQHIQHLASLGKFKPSAEQLEELGISPSDTDIINSMSSFEQEDELIYEILNEFKIQEQLKSSCRIQTLYRLIDTKPGCYGIIRAKYSPKIKESLINKYGDRLIEIVNERFMKN